MTTDMIQLKAYGGLYMTENEFKQRYISDMSTQQKQAVTTTDGAVLLLAVPGSGKTTVLITRRYL